MRFNPGFVFREALNNVRANLLMSITAVITAFLCLLILGIGLLVSAHVQQLIDNVREGVEITAYFPEDTSQERMSETVGSVKGYPEVQSATFISQEEALQQFKETYEEQPGISQNLDAGVLPASVEISLKNPEQADAVTQRLVEREGFPEEELRYPQQTVERVNTVADSMLFGLRAATALFLVASVLLISNSIRLSIFARRQEIEVMKLVGASDNFVRTPFVAEGLLQGVAGALFAFGAVVWLNVLFVDWANDQIPFIAISGGAVNYLLVLAVLVGVGAVIGALGSFISVRRYLKV